MAILAIFNVLQKCHFCAYLVTFCHFWHLPKVTFWGPSGDFSSLPRVLVSIFLAFFHYLAVFVILAISEICHIWRIPRSGHLARSGVILGSWIWPSGQIRGMPESGFVLDLSRNTGMRSAWVGRSGWSDLARWG